MIKDMSRKTYEITSKDNRIKIRVEFGASGAGTVNLWAKGDKPRRDAAAKIAMEMPDRTMGDYNVSDTMSWTFASGVTMETVKKFDAVLEGPALGSPASRSKGRR